MTKFSPKRASYTKGKLSLQFIVATILSWVRDFITAPECPDQIISWFHLHSKYSLSGKSFLKVKEYVRYLRYICAPKKLSLK